MEPQKVEVIALAEKFIFLGHYQFGIDHKIIIKGNKLNFTKA
jgi:hypothetical protein